MRNLLRYALAFPIGVVLALLFFALGGCTYPTEPVIVVDVHCIGSDSVVVTDSLVSGCIDPRELPTDSLPEVPDA